MTDLERVSITVPALIGMAFAGTVILLLPFVMWIVWRKKTRAAWIPLLAGLIGYLFAGTIHGLFRAICLSGMQDTPWAFYLCQALSAAVTEEGARYLIFRFGIPNRDLYRDAVSYGIGHGGLEHILVGGGGVLLYGFLTGLAYKTLHGLSAFAPGEPAAFLMAGQDVGGMIGILEGISEYTFTYCLFAAAVSVTGLLFQCCLSVLVFTAVHYDLNLKWFAAALGLHVLADIIPALHLAGDFSRTEADVLLLLFDIGVIYLTYRVWKHYRPEPSDTEFLTDQI